MVLSLPVVSLRHSGSTSLSSSLSLRTDLKWSSLLRYGGGRLLGLLTGESSPIRSTGSSSGLGPGEAAAMLATSSGPFVSTQVCSTPLFAQLLLSSEVVSDGPGLGLPANPVCSSLEAVTALVDLSDFFELNELFLDFTGVSKSSRSSQSSIGNPRDVSRFGGVLCELPFEGAAVAFVAESAKGLCRGGGHLSFWLMLSDLPFERIGKIVLILFD